MERLTWVLAILFYGVADVTTTAISESLGGYESNRIAAQLYSDMAVPGLILHKFLVIAILLLCWYYYPSVAGYGPIPQRFMVPLITLLGGILLAAQNTQVILQLL